MDRKENGARFADAERLGVAFPDAKSIQCGEECLGPLAMCRPNNATSHNAKRSSLST
jgi:hypothetical protein